ncbi:MAG: hypothetical protein AAF517_20950 [Planctomycetota bacterium]
MRATASLLVFGVGLCFCSTALADEKPKAKPKRLRRIDDAPVYVRNKADRSKWPRRIREGIDATRKYFGNYGPVYVYLLGPEDKKLNTKEFHRKIVETYCKNRAQGDPDRLAACRARTAKELTEKALKGRGDAYLSYVDSTKPPIAELVFINPHEFHDPYICTRGIHEYTHVYQKAFPRQPTWMTEGGAEFFAAYLGEKHGWASFRKAMKGYLENARRVEDPKLGIEHMEDVDKVSPSVKKYYRHLAYDSGAWAFAYLIHRSKHRRISDVKTVFYPLVAKHGWEKAVARFAQVKDKREFYEGFREFAKRPLAELLDVLKTLKD